MEVSYGEMASSTFHWKGSTASVFDYVKASFCYVKASIIVRVITSRKVTCDPRILGIPDLPPCEMVLGHDDHHLIHLSFVPALFPDSSGGLDEVAYVLKCSISIATYTSRLYIDFHVLRSLRCRFMKSRSVVLRSTFNMSRSDHL